MCLRHTQHRSQGGRPISVAARASDTSAYQIRFPETWKPPGVSVTATVHHKTSNPLSEEKDARLSLRQVTNASTGGRRAPPHPFVAHARRGSRGTLISHGNTALLPTLASSRTDHSGPPKLSRDQLGSRQPDSLSGMSAGICRFILRLPLKKQVSQPPIFPTDDSSSAASGRVLATVVTEGPGEKTPNLPSWVIRPPRLVLTTGLGPLK